MEPWSSGKELFDKNDRVNEDKVNVSSTTEKVVKTRKENKQTLCNIVKDILEKELKAMIPEIIKTLLEEISEVKATVTRNMAKVTFNTLSQLSNKEELTHDKQSDYKNDMLVHNKSDEQQIRIEEKH
eukprot:10782026-Ditylum_brightwellii.AAC.1